MISVEQIIQLGLAGLAMYFMYNLSNSSIKESGKNTVKALENNTSAMQDMRDAFIKVCDKLEDSG